MRKGNMNISYFTTYPLLLVSFAALLFFIFSIVKANRTNNISPNDAIETQGTIVDIRSSSGENSAFVNVVIRVEFNTQANTRVISEGRATIDVVKIPQYQAGATVPLIYSRENPKKIRLKIPSPLKR